MLESNEVIDLILTAGVLTFFLWDRERLRAFPAFGTLLASLACLFAALLFTVLEGLLWGELLDLFEHVGYAASGVLLTIWCWSAFIRGRSPR